MPTPSEWGRMAAQTKIDFIARERDRWVNGLWFWNYNPKLGKSEMTYITGKHYDHLTYQVFEYEVKYLDSQRHDWYFRDLVKKHEFCYGGLKVKPRRYGSTDEEVTDNIVESINGKDKKTGMMSENRDKVYATIYDKMTATYLKRPPFIRPEIFMRNGMVPRKKIEWRPNKVKWTIEDGMTIYDMSGVLGSLAEPKATTVIGYDGWKLHKLTMDEVWKWIACSPYDCWEKQKKCLFDGGNIIGYCMMLSTMGDDDSYDEAIKAGIKMWHDSNPFELDDNGFTKTGLFRYFISGHYALRKFADKYGFIDMVAAQTYILNERKKYVHGSPEWLGEVRRSPLNIEEALGTALSGGLFDSERIQSQITIITNRSDIDKGYIEAKLEEDNMGDVHVTPDKNEPWLISIMPHDNPVNGKKRNNRFRKFKKNGQTIWMPPTNPEGVAGYDQVRYSDVDTTSGSLSQASIIGRIKHDYYQRGIENKYIGLYLDRPSDPYEAHYEYFKFLRCYNLLGMHERQVETTLDMFRELNAESFLLKNPKDGKYGIWTDNQRKVIKTGVDLFYTWQKKPRADTGEVDNIAGCYLIPFLEQAKDFNVLKSTKFDAFMSNIMLEHGWNHPDMVEKNISDNYNAQKSYEAIMNSLAPGRGGNPNPTNRQRQR